MRTKKNGPADLASRRIAQIGTALGLGLERAADIEGAADQKGPDVLTIRTILVSPGRDWEAYLAPEDHAAFRALYESAIARRAAGAPHTNWMAETQAPARGPIPAETKDPRS